MPEIYSSKSCMFQQAHDLGGGLQTTIISAELQQLVFPHNNLENTRSGVQSIGFFQKHKMMSLMKVLFIWAGSITRRQNTEVGARNAHVKAASPSGQKDVGWCDVQAASI